MNETELTALRHEFHRFPELGFAEHSTKDRIASLLTSFGLEVHIGVGVVGVLKRGTGNRTIGLRADIDALPISETSAHAYVSKTDGVMHACGHDGHMTMLLGAAENLARGDSFDGTVIFIFQPNEEHGLGAQAMIKEGLLRRFPMEEVYAIHNLPGALAGRISTRTGQICSSESLFEITVKGQGGHAAMPHVGRDSILIGSEIVLALQTIVARKLAPGSGAVVSVTEFLTDGQRNVLPSNVVLKGDVRACVLKDRKAISAFMTQICEGIGDAHGAKVSVAFNTEFIETINAAVPVIAAVKAAKSIGIEATSDREPMSFSEDFAHFSAVVPGCFMLLGNGTDGPNGRPLHSADYDFNDQLLPIGAAFWTQLVTDRLPKAVSL
ncbi:MAG: amidohydrolase [Planktomarina sp.]|nr:amidohydrolase [Planktomarina sp.]|tara:strand:- start:805 stop:1947 length:1143 start_codon:yes stop_codon:yes gene_type:complete